jgi:hypothetical protein
MADECPPSWMWPFEEELEIWFEEVDSKRKERYGGTDASEGESVPMMSNELAQGKRS